VRAQVSKVGQILVDSLPFSQSGSANAAMDLRTAGADALAGYLGVINESRVWALLDAGLGFLPVTLAGEYRDGAADEVAQLKALGIPKGVTVFLDLEGKGAFQEEPELLKSQITGWAVAIAAAGYIPSLYVGVPQPLTSDELWKLPVQRYWRGQGSVRDRYNQLAEPTGCGWCITQMYPSHFKGNVWVDSNMIGQDYKGRTPVWAVK
jgi:hypothetical protein